MINNKSREHIYQMIKSMFGGTLATGVFIVSSYFMDHIIDPKISNAVALLLGATCNFFLQQLAFLSHTKEAHSRIVKFLISEVFILGGAQLGVTYLLDNEKVVERHMPKQLLRYTKYYNTFIRFAVTALVFIFISYPIRKYWVFSE